MKVGNCERCGGLYRLWKVGVLVAVCAGTAAHAATVTLGAARGTVIASSTSLGAFSFASAPETGATFSFQGATWEGTLAAVSQFPDEVLPGRFTGVVVVTNGEPPTGENPVLNLPVEVAVIIASPPWILRPLGASGAAGELRMNEAPDVLRFDAGATYSYTFTAQPDGLNVRFNGSAEMPVAGGGVAKLSISGNFAKENGSAAGGTVSWSLVLRLEGVDAGRFLGSDILLTARETSPWLFTSPTPPAP